MMNTQLLQRLHKSVTIGRGDPWSGPSVVPEKLEYINNTIWGLKPSLFIVDEIQSFRINPHPLFFFRDCAQFTIGLTGTPLITDPKVCSTIGWVCSLSIHGSVLQDIIHLGWAIGTPNLQDAQKYKELQDMQKSAKKAMKSARKGEDNMHNWGVLVCQGHIDAASDYAPFVNARAGFDAVVEQIRKAFGDHILRHTPKSKNRSGKGSLVELLEVTFVSVWVHLDDEHLQVLKEASDDAIMKAVEIDNFGVCIVCFHRSLTYFYFNSASTYSLGKDQTTLRLLTLDLMHHVSVQRRPLIRMVVRNGR